MARYGSTHECGRTLCDTMRSCPQARSGRSRPIAASDRDRAVAPCPWSSARWASAAYCASCSQSVYLGLDWFLLKVFFLALVFVPLQRLSPHRAEQGPFRFGWRLDLVSLFVSHLPVQVSVFFTLMPASVFFSWAGGERSTPARCRVPAVYGRSSRIFHSPVHIRHNEYDTNETRIADASPRRTIRRRTGRGTWRSARSDRLERATRASATRCGVSKIRNRCRLG